MPPETPRATKPAPNSESRHERRNKMLPAALLAWALISTGIAGWMVFQPKGPSQNDIWASDAGTLLRLWRDFGFVALDTNQFLSTRDANWTWNAFNWAALSSEAVGNAAAAPGGFPSGQPLGFNGTAMCVAMQGYNYISNEAASGTDYPYILQAVATQRGIYQNLSARLDQVQYWSDGRDPLSVIGAANVTAIHTLMATLWAANMPVGYSQTGLISMICGV